MCTDCNECFDTSFIVLPNGDTGIQGPAGPDGEQGEQGPIGLTGAYKIFASVPAVYTDTGSGSFNGQTYTIPTSNLTTNGEAIKLTFYTKQLLTGAGDLQVTIGVSNPFSYTFSGDNDTLRIEMIFTKNGTGLLYSGYIVGKTTDGMTTDIIYTEIGPGSIGSALSGSDVSLGIRLNTTTVTATIRNVLIEILKF